MIDKRLHIALFCLLTCLSFGGASAFAQPPIDREYEYKAAYLYHFANLCEWPGEGRERVVIGVLGDSTRFAKQLDRIVRQGERLPTPIRVVRFREIRDITQCDILFISGKSGEISAENAQRQLVAVRAKMRTPELVRTPALIFTENHANFAQQGAAVSFHVENNRLRFLANLAAARAANVTIPQSLTGLRNARVVVP